MRLRELVNYIKANTSITVYRNNEKLYEECDYIERADDSDYEEFDKQYGNHDVRSISATGKGIFIGLY